MRVQDWLGFLSLGAALLALVALLLGNTTGFWVCATLALALGVLTRFWSVRFPAPIPYRLRWTLRVPRGNQSPTHLLKILQPRPGERVLEVGPGTGLHALAVAPSLAPDGRLDVLDVQQEMLDDVVKRASEDNVDGIVATRGDARDLPYPDSSFDAAYLVGVLGEIPDGDATLRELRRVIKPTGRLIVGEVFFDPDFVGLPDLESRAAKASFAFDLKLGGSLSFLARFLPT